HAGVPAAAPTLALPAAARTRAPARRPVPVAEPVHEAGTRRAWLHAADPPPAVLPPARRARRSGAARASVLPLRRPARAAEGRPGARRGPPLVQGSRSPDRRRRRVPRRARTARGRARPRPRPRPRPPLGAPAAVRRRRLAARVLDRLRGVRHRRPRGLRPADTRDRARPGRPARG